VNDLPRSIEAEESTSYIRTTDGEEMVQIAPHQFISRKAQAILTRRVLDEPVATPVAKGDRE
jgi:hypothetical protein